MLYAAYAESAPGGPAGGSAVGLTFGITGSAFILFAALLGVRKRRPHYRLGRASTWLKGHLWLGALAFPLIFFHGGFEFGGPLTRVLMWIFVLVFVTGVFGLALQQILPRFMTRTLPQETVYEQIDHVREQLLEEAVEMAHRDAKRGAVLPLLGRVGEAPGPSSQDLGLQRPNLRFRFGDLIAQTIEPVGAGKLGDGCLEGLDPVMERFAQILGRCRKRPP